MSGTGKFKDFKFGMQICDKAQTRNMQKQVKTGVAWVN